MWMRWIKICSIYTVSQEIELILGCRWSMAQKDETDSYLAIHRNCLRMDMVINGLKANINQFTN